MQNKVDRKTLSKQIVERLRADIITRVFPVGSHITVKSIAEKYDTSPIPIREAFNVLSGEKLITLVPYKGATVCSINRQFFENIYRILSALELMMMDTALENWSEAMYQRLTDLNEQIHELQTMDLIRDRYQDLNDEFHAALEQYSENEQALALEKSYRRIIRLVTSEYDGILASVDRLNEAYEEHKAMIAALQSQDIEACWRAFRIHAINSCESVVEKIFGQENQRLDDFPAASKKDC